MHGPKLVIDRTRGTLEYTARGVLFNADCQERAKSIGERKF